MSGARLGLFLVSALALAAPAASRAHHTCDDLGQPGWRTVLSHETVNVADGTPHAVGEEWFVERATTTLPLCNYINAAGNYSLRSYSLSPETSTERVLVCKGSTSISPYAGPCPPR